MIPIVCVFGPTASGKSDVAIDVARAVHGEIVNADAAQIYRGLDRGAAKLMLAERRGVAHHLMDLADPDIVIPVAVYQELAWQSIAEIRRRGHVPIVCGGSGMYVRAALGEWRFEGTPPDPAMRRELRALPDAELQGRLRQVDPEAAALLGASDRPRLLRALERRLGPDGAQVQRAPAPLGPIRKFGLYVPRDELYRHIDERALRLWPSLLKEAELLIARSLTGDLPAQRAIGYGEAMRFLRGDLAEGDAIRMMQQSTRRLAKRQMTWWRREPNTIWLHPQGAADRIVDVLRSAERGGQQEVPRRGGQE